MTKPITKKDVWLALFSLDSYQRGYDLQIRTITRSETHLGNAELKSYPISSQNGWEAAGFYAQAYDITAVAGLSGSNTVIAYRGTDDGPTGGSDVWNGWAVGAGSTGVTVTLAITPKLHQTQLCLGGEGARSTWKRWERFRLDTQLLRSQSVAKLAEPD
jgi:hypothetical protein